VNFKAEDIDWQSRTISYFRMKTGTPAQFTISKKLKTVLSHLPTTGALFPKLSMFTANDRASRFRRRCHKAGVFGVTLHCCRYAWAECFLVCNRTSAFWRWFTPPRQSSGQVYYFSA